MTDTRDEGGTRADVGAYVRPAPKEYLATSTHQRLGKLDKPRNLNPIISKAQDPERPVPFQDLSDILHAILSNPKPRCQPTSHARNNALELKERARLTRRSFPLKSNVVKHPNLGKWSKLLILSNSAAE